MKSLKKRSQPTFKELDEINSDMTVSAIHSGPSDVDLGMENYFEWVNSTSTGSYYNKDGEQGYFRYIGTGKEVIEIPHVIQGVEMTSYYRMFYQTGEDVKKVISTNENVTYMGSMFQDSQATELDLSSFDTSNVTDMRSMFEKSQARTVYARTRKDANRFNETSGKPVNLTFQVKSN